MKYPLEKYKFYRHKNQVIAVSSFAGRTVKGTATCHEEDTFNLEVGKKLAALRCAEKIAKKRMERAQFLYSQADAEIEKALQYKYKMSNYFTDACDQYNEAVNEINDMYKELGCNDEI